MGKSEKIGKIEKGFEIIDTYYKKNSTIYVIKCCDCGKIQERRISNFKKRGALCSCQIEKRKESEEERKLRYVYYAMIRRCQNTNCKEYKNYGGRGIKVCDEWLNKKNGKRAFIKWSIENSYQNNLSLDRINNNGNYEPSNCRWVDRKVQNKNKTRVHHIKYNNNIYTLKEFCDLKCANYISVINKTKKMSLSEIFNENIIDDFEIRNDNFMI